jgi:hypothetical protein
VERTERLFSTHFQYVGPPADLVVRDDAYSACLRYDDNGTFIATRREQK